MGHHYVYIYIILYYIMWDTHFNKASPKSQKNGYDHPLNMARFIKMFLALGFCH